MATNLEFINSFEITSSTSAFNCDNIFSADYDVYEIYIRNLATVGTTETSLYFRFIDSGEVLLMELLMIMLHWK